MDKSTDRLRRASGETEEEIFSHKPLKSEKPENKAVTEQVCMEVIIALESFTGRELTVSETELWKSRLMKYPYWKLCQVDQYTGGLNNDFFRWLDNLRRPEEQPSYLHQLPAPQCDTAKKTCAYLGVLYSEATKETKDQAEKEWVEYMRSRNIPGVYCQRASNK